MGIVVGVHWQPPEGFAGWIDLAHHHRFLQEAEALRYAFVQGLNRLHAEKLAYSDDVRRSGDALAEERTRVDATHWQLLDHFVFEPDAAGSRIAQARPQWLMLCLWCAVLVGAGFWIDQQPQLRRDVAVLALLLDQVLGETDT